MYSSKLAIKNSILEDYFRYIFPPEKEGGPCVVSACHPTGALIIALADASAFPFHIEGDHIVEVDIPWSRNATSAIDGHWVSFSKGAMSRINLALQAEFDIEFAGYYRKGEQLGMRKMDIIDAFILTRGLSAGTYDALHKRTYRKELKNQEKVRKQLLRRAYYINESIDYSGLKTNETSGD